MKPRFSLPTRIFLLAVVTVALVAGAGFWTLNRVLRETIKARLKESFRISSAQMNAASVEYRTRNTQMLAALSENAGLKAAMGLLQELPPGERTSETARRTIETNLVSLGRGLGYQLMLAADASGQPVAGMVSRPWGTVPVDPLPSRIAPEPLIEFQGQLYDATTVPVNLGDENLGSLTVAREFDLMSISPSEKAALLVDQRIIRSTLPSEELPDWQKALSERCSPNEESCELTVNGETYLALPLTPIGWMPGTRLLGLQSLDREMNRLTRDFLKIFLLVGMVGLICAVLLASLGSRSVTKPITDLVLRLKVSGERGRLRSDFPADSSIEEVNLLARSLNEAALALAGTQEKLDDANLEFLETMARALDARDPYTAGHSDRVSANSTAMAEAMNLPKQEVEIIRIGAKMHDIGKIGVPDRVLQKPGKLDDEELALIRLHPQIGKRILEKVEAFRDYLPIIELHHENHDGTGYPYGLKGDEIPLGVRIVHVADVYDAITSNRAYRAAMPREKVLEIMIRGAGTEFDPEVVKVLLRLLNDRDQLDRILTEVREPICSETLTQV